MGFGPPQGNADALIDISAVNFSAGTTSGNLSNVVFSNSNGVSFGINGSTITGTVATTYAGSNVTASFGTASYYANIDNYNGMVTGASAIAQTSGSSIFVQPFQLPQAISLSYVRLLASFNDTAVGTAGTTSNDQTFSCERYTTFGLVVYTQGTGASSLSIRSYANTTVGLTGRTIYGGGTNGSRYTVTLQKTYPATGAVNNQYTTSYAVSSASIVISSNSNTLFTGPRFLDLAWATSFSAGNYWLGLGASTSSNTNSSHISFAGTAAMPISIAGVSQSNVSVGILGAATAASNYQLQPGLGVWTTDSSGFSTASMALANISQVASNPAIPFQFIRQA